MADDDEDMRFSDEKLNTFYQEFMGLSERFDAAEARELERDVREQARDDVIRVNTETMQELNANTATLVQAWADAESVVRVGSKLGKLVKWLSGLAFIGVIFAALVDKFGGS